MYGVAVAKVRFSSLQHHWMSALVVRSSPRKWINFLSVNARLLDNMCRKEQTTTEGLRESLKDLSIRGVHYGHDEHRRGFTGCYKAHDFIQSRAQLMVFLFAHTAVWLSNCPRELLVVNATFCVLNHCLQSQ